MTEGDRAAVDVHALGIEPKLADHADGLRGEGFVQLEEIDVSDGEPGAVKQLADRRHRAQAHHPRVDAGARAAEDAGDGIETAAVGFVDDQHRRCAVVERR